MRFFSHAGREYTHASAVPLTYLSLSPEGRRWLETYRTPQIASPRIGDEAFLLALHRAGVLRDPEHADPIHDLMPATDQVATLYLYPTNSCNLRCIYCYATSGPGAGPRLSPDHARMAVDDFFDTLNERVRLVELRFHGGGEPTTNFAVMAASWEQFQQRAHAAGVNACVPQGPVGSARLL
jgi:sulfatase maturation enzyme AslB (radical SAM superfamily)